MDSEDHLEELATELFGKGKGWGLVHIAAGTALMGYFAWAGALVLGLRKVSVQVPYVPSSAKQIENMMSLLKGRSGKLVDLGSGDGRIVLEAYKQGFSPAIGYELNPWLVQLSNLRAWRAGCYGKVFYHKEDLWKADLSDCNNVMVFLAPSVITSEGRQLEAAGTVNWRELDAADKPSQVIPSALGEMKELLVSLCGRNLEARK
ncbi:adenine nucleotide translocase lysine N-methyltransferase-like isoform X2 [Tiliqua scincoides]|uniref:adenine nucleotide translocase lysine N-methyltransferase-like isoform X2 n=1 Tax=Tiliqua scincoides TaxID=71010 RepID=UPI0034629E5A